MQTTFCDFAFQEMPVCASKAAFSWRHVFHFSIAMQKFNPPPTPPRAPISPHPNALGRCYYLQQLPLTHTHLISSHSHLVCFPYVAISLRITWMIMWGLRSGVGEGILAELLSESKLQSHSSPPKSQHCVYLNRQRENCAAISNLNCYFLPDAVDSFPPFDNLCLLFLILFCFSFCARPLSALYSPTPPPPAPPSLPPSHCHCHPAEAAPWCHSQGQREHGWVNHWRGATALRRVRILGPAADLHDYVAASARPPTSPTSLPLHFSPRGKLRRLVSEKTASNQWTHCSATSEVGGEGTKIDLTVRGSIG